METLTPLWTDYQLLDSGEGKKLERFGEFRLIRPEPQAAWKPALPVRWRTADAEFVKPKSVGQGTWKFRKPLPERWPMSRKELKFWVQPAPSGHVGVFPDQACHWDWIAETIRLVANPIKMLCLFGHTGLATLAAAAAGAEVTHVDASRQPVTLARENQRLSGLGDRPIRWIVEDASTFVKREARRGKQYNAIVLDPPRFGRGPGGEIWKLQQSLSELLSACARILSPSPSFVLLNVYTTVRSQDSGKEARALRSSLKTMLGKSRLTSTPGALFLEDSSRRRISTSVFARAR